jgi:hypothetical protein
MGPVTLEFRPESVSVTSFWQKEGLLGGASIETDTAAPLLLSL